LKYCFAVFSSVLLNVGVNTTASGAIGPGVDCVWPVFILIPTSIHAGRVSLIGGVSTRRFGGDIVTEVIPGGVVTGFDFSYVN
jgi:hypothetical protein